MAFAPESLVKYWVCPDGKLTLVRFGQHHFEQIPAKAGVPAVDYDAGYDEGDSNIETACNESGYYRGTLLNERLYVVSNSQYPVPRRVVKLLEDMCIEKGWERGVMVEEL